MVYSSLFAMNTRYIDFWFTPTAVETHRSMLRPLVACEVLISQAVEPVPDSLQVDQRVEPRFE
jgi:hypothetical protein